MRLSLLPKRIQVQLRQYPFRVHRSARIQNVVEYDIGDSHDDCIHHQYFGAGDSYEKGPEHHTDRSEQESEYPILHVIFSGLTYGSGGDEDFQHLWGPYKRSEDEDY